MRKQIVGATPAMQMHLMREQALAERAKTDPAYAEFIKRRTKARELGLDIFAKAGFHVEIVGGYDDDSIVKITATELEVAADLKTVVGPEKQVVSAEYAECTPRLVIDGVDIAAYCDGFMLDCSRNGRDPLTIRPRIKGSRAYIIGGD